MARISDAVLRLSLAEATRLIEELETGGVNIESGQLTLLQRFFLEEEDTELWERYKAALEKLSE
jgi:hypothetical protein